MFVCLVWLLFVQKSVANIIRSVSLSLGVTVCSGIVYRYVFLRKKNEKEEVQINLLLLLLLLPQLFMPSLTLRFQRNLTAAGRHGEPSMTTAHSTGTKIKQKREKAGKQFAGTLIHFNGTKRLNCGRQQDTQTKGGQEGR